MAGRWAEVRLRAARRARPDTAARQEPGPEEDSGPRRRGRQFTGLPAATALISALSIGIVATVSPAAGAAGDMAVGLAQTVQQLVSSSRNAQAFSGTPAVGALFTWSGGKLGSHFCSGSVISSPHGDLVITAAHCASSTSAMVFVPGYNRGSAPYGVWTVTRVYQDQAWKSSADPDDDVAILQVSQPSSSTAIEDVTGAEQLATGTAARQLVEVIGYPDTADGPVACRNWTTEPMAGQLEFDCGGYPDGTSGGPFLADVNPSTGQGTVIGVIGGYEQGGDTPQVSYSSVFGSNVESLYAEAVAGS